MIVEYLQNEPGRIINVEEEMLKSKDQREDEAKARTKQLASCKDWMEGRHLWKTKHAWFPQMPAMHTLQSTLQHAYPAEHTL